MIALGKPRAPSAHVSARGNGRLMLAHEAKGVAANPEKMGNMPRRCTDLFGYSKCVLTIATSYDANACSMAPSQARLLDLAVVAQEQLAALRSSNVVLRASQVTDGFDASAPFHRAGELRCVRDAINGAILTQG